MTDTKRRYPRFFKDGANNVVEEFNVWQATPNGVNDAADTLAKLDAIVQRGAEELILFGDDTFSPPDLYCRQCNGWACFYVVKPLASGGADVVALHVAKLPASSISPLLAEANRRRKLFGI